MGKREICARCWCGNLYITEMKNNETLPVETRVAAAEAWGILLGMRVMGHGLAATWAEGTLKRAMTEYRVNYRSLMNEAGAKALDDAAEKPVRMALPLREFRILYWMATSGFRRLLVKGSFQKKENAEEAHNILDRPARPHGLSSLP
jgi:hypothetical protein